MKAPIKPLGYSVLVSLISAMAAHPAWAQVLAIAPAAASQPADALDVTTNAPLPALGATTHKINHDDRATPLAKTQPTHWLAQGENEQAVITDVQITPTSEGLTVTLISEQALANGTSRVEGNALITEIPNARLALTNATAAEQFDPADGIALVQVSSLPTGGIRVVITGTEAPPEAEVSAQADSWVLSVVPGAAATGTEAPDAIQVVVTATRTEESVLDVPRSVTVIEREQIEQQLSFTNNLPDVLGKLVPGLSAPPFTNSTSELALRGRPVVIFIDGVPQTPNSNGNAADLRIIDPALVERIEVLRGPSAIYGDGGTGGIINIITRAPTEDAIAYTFSTGASTSLTSFGGDSFGYNVQMGVSASDEQADGLLSLSYDAVNSQYDADGDRIIPTNVSDTSRLGLLAKLGYNFDEQQRLALTYSFYRDSLDTEFIPDERITQVPGLQKGRTFRIGSVDYESEPRQINHVIDLTYRHANVFGSELNAQFYYRDRELVQRFTDLRLNPLSQLPILDPFPDVWQTGLDATEWGGRLQMDTPLSESASLLWGVDYSSERNNRPLRVSDNAAFDANRELNIVDTSLTQGGPYTLRSVGLFTQGSWDITEQWQISGGLRYENFNVSVDDYRLAFVTTSNLPRERQGGDNNFDDVAFNAGLIYRPIPEIGLFANFSQGFSIPDVGSVLGGVASTFDINSDLLLEPQKVDNYEVGIRAEFGRVQATVTGFYSESDLGNSIVIDENGLGTLVRAPQRNYGVEATVDWQPSNTWRLGGLFSWNEGENDVDEDGDFDPLGSVNVQPYKVGLYIENDTTPGWTNRLELLAIGSRDRAADEGIDDVAIDGYVTVDFLSRIQLGGGQLTLGIGNLFNNQYLPVATQVLTAPGVEARRAAAPGRTVSLRYAIEF
ncbi:MAG: TonB-dependent receptor [Leptolyngbya sp. SIO1E4]|nr:TonB-dependent receptor [Leptolyngbya sp. SIO1E4]